MKKVTVIVLAILVMAMGAWAQNWTNQGADRLNSSGSHVGGSGCKLCHTPHTVGANNAAYTARLSSTATAAQQATWANNFGGDFAANGVSPATFNPCTSSGTNYASCVNMANNGMQTGAGAAVYLWAVALTPQTYTTYNGDQISSAANWNKSDAAVHTLVCLTCHDNATGTHEMAAYGGAAGSWTNTSGFENTIEIGQGEAMGNSTYNCNWDGAKCNAAWSTNSSLQTSHPVHVKYSGSYMWAINPDGTFQDTSFAYGHPAKLWTMGNDAYVECTSCHDPHRRYYTSYWNGTNYTVSPTANTDFYIRGPYVPPSETATTGGVTNASFCRSCHYSKTQEYINNLGVAK